MKSKEKLDSFMKHCEDNPEQRFWQALRNWAGSKFIFAGDFTKKMPKLSYLQANLSPNERMIITEWFGMRDTYYWE